MKFYYYNTSKDEQIPETFSKKTEIQKSINISHSAQEIPNPENMKASIAEISQIPIQSNLDDISYKKIETPSPHSMTVDDAVMRVTCTARIPNEAEPWVQGESAQMSSSCSVVKFMVNDEEKVFLMTNAHAVNNCYKDELGNREVLLSTHQNKMRKAKVYATLKNSDLALLKFSDDQVAESYRDIAFELQHFDGKDWGKIDIPEKDQPLIVKGYPFGMKGLVTTNGSVTSVVSENYAHYGDIGLTYSTNATINGGNSGGPVLSVDNKFMGTVFEGKGGNTFFFIPKENSYHFAYRIDQAERTGNKPENMDFPYFQHNLKFQSTLASGLREYFAIDSHLSAHPKYRALGKQIGVYLASMPSITRSSSQLQPRDIVLSINGHPILSDGTFLYKGNPLHMDSINMFLNEQNRNLSMDVLRPAGPQNKDSKILTLSHTADTYKSIINQALCDSQEDYYVAGGCVLQNLSLSKIRSSLSTAPNFNELYMLQNGQVRYNDETAVVLSTIVPNSLNKDYMGLKNMVIKEINGTPVRNLQHAMLLCESTDRLSGGFLRIKTDTDNLIVLNFNGDQEKQCGYFKRNAKLNSASGVPSPGYNVAAMKKFECDCKSVTDCGQPQFLNFGEDRIACRYCDKELGTFNLSLENFALSPISSGISSGSVVEGEKRGNVGSVNGEEGSINNKLSGSAMSMGKLVFSGKGTQVHAVQDENDNGGRSNGKKLGQY